MGCNYKNWAVNIQKCTKQVISFGNIIVWIWKFSFHYLLRAQYFFRFLPNTNSFSNYIESDSKFQDIFFGSHQNVEFWLNSVLIGWFKLLIVVLARKWVVILTDCKWVVVNSIRIQKWAVHSYKTQMGYKFSATHMLAY